MKIFRTLFLFLFTLSSTIASYAQFVSGCTVAFQEGQNRSTRTQQCSCPPNAGQCVQLQMLPTYVGSLLPCPGTTEARFNNTVQVTPNCIAPSTSQATYRIIMRITPALYIDTQKSITVPAVPAGFTAQVQIPANSPVGCEVFSAALGYTAASCTRTPVAIPGTPGTIIVTYTRTFTGAFPAEASNIDMTTAFTLTAATPVGFPVGVQIASSVLANLGGEICQGRVESRGAPALCAFDPNMKTVYPEGCGPKHLVNATDTLTYHILFQNTGDAPALDVVLRDTLSPNLDLSTLEFLYATHAYTYDISADNVLEIRFNNIYLPDSTSDLEGSQGWVAYRVLPRPGLSPGDQIVNRAAIYFDRNPPIITNAVLNTIQDPQPQRVNIANKVQSNCGISRPITFTASPAQRYLWSTGDTTQSISVATPGNYVVTAFYPYTCQSSSDTATLRATNPPVIATIRNPGSICPGQCDTLGIGVQVNNCRGATTFTWLRGDSILTSRTTLDCEGGQPKSYLPICQPGTYRVRVTDKFGCTTERSVSIAQKQTCNSAARTGAKGTGETAGISIYPNPMHKETSLSVKGIGKGAASVTITDLSGKTIYRNAKVVAGKPLLIGNNLPKGVYFVRIVTAEGQVVVRKLVKQD